MEVSTVYRDKRQVLLRFFFNLGWGLHKTCMKSNIYDNPCLDWLNFVGFNWSAGQVLVLLQGT